MPVIAAAPDERGVAGSYNYFMQIDGRTIARVAVFPYEHAPENWILTRLWVAPAYRRQKLASALMQYVCRLADEQGKIIRLTPEPTFGDEIALATLVAFYRRFGFTGNCGMLRQPQS